MEVITTRCFTRSDRREYVRSGTRISGAAHYLQELVRNQMAREVQAHVEAPEGPETCLPPSVIGAPLSALPVARVSPQTIVKKSKRGALQKAKKVAL